MFTVSVLFCFFSVRPIVGDVIRESACTQHYRDCSRKSWHSFEENGSLPECPDEYAIAEDKMARITPQAHLQKNKGYGARGGRGV